MAHSPDRTGSARLAKLGWAQRLEPRLAASLFRPLLLAPEWMEPLLDFSVRARPAAYAASPAPVGTVVTLIVHGPRLAS